MDRPDAVVTAEPRRPNSPQAFRRAIVEETLKPGASSSRIAREHDLNVNMVFKWRQRYRKEVEAVAARIADPDDAGTALMPVSVINAPSPPKNEPSTTTSAICEVEIEVGKRRIRILGISTALAERILLDCLK